MNKNFELELSALQRDAVKCFGNIKIHLLEHSVWSQKHYKFIPQWILEASADSGIYDGFIVSHAIVDWLIAQGFDMVSNVRSELFTSGDLTRTIRNYYIDKVLSTL